MQGVRFSAASVEGSAYLLAANGNELYATALELQSVSVKNNLSKHGGSADTSKATSAANRLLNYVHSCCLRFPLDDCIGLAEASQRAQRREATACRTVRLHIATRAPQQFCSPVAGTCVARCGLAWQIKPDLTPESQHHHRTWQPSVIVRANSWLCECV